MRLNNQSFVRTHDYFWIILGSFLTASSINIFMLPYKIAPGGVSGIATVLYYLSNGKFPLGVTMLVLNIPLFIGGMRFIGGKFIVRTLFSTLLLSLFTDFTKPFSVYFAEKYLGKFDGVSSAPDLLLFSIFGGLLMGFGLGLVFRSGATTGGTDLAAKIVKHFVPNFTMGQILLAIDTCIIIFAMISFKSVTIGLYSIVTLVISSKVIDAILEGVNFAKAVFIISNKPDEIAAKILKELDRGVTGFNGKGMYTGNDKRVLYCIMDRGQIPVLKNIVKQVDDKAFVILSDVREVLGEGFKAY